MESMDASEQRAGRGWFRAGGFAKWAPPMIHLYISGLKTGKEPTLPERTAQHWARTYQAVRCTAVVSLSSSSSSNSLLPSSNGLAIVVLVSFVESFVSPEVVSLIVAVADPLLAFLSEKKGRKGSGWRGTARWDRPGRSDGCLWRRIRRLWTRYHVGGIVFIALWCPGVCVERFLDSE